MKKLISLVLIGFLLSGCMFRVHKRDIAQGNIITQEDVSRLHPGMSKAQVKEVMGDPVLMNIFTPDRLEYVYTFKAGHEQMTQKRVLLIFQQDRLKQIIKN